MNTKKYPLCGEEKVKSPISPDLISKAVLKCMLKYVGLTLAVKFFLNKKLEGRKKVL